MRKLIYSLGLLSSISVYSQVGIGTTTPRGTLDVNGNTLVEDHLVINNLTQIPMPSDAALTANPGNGPFLVVRSNDSTNGPKGEIKLLDISSRLVAPVNKYSVTIANLDSRSVTEINTNLRTDKYVVAVTDATFTNAAINKNSNNNYGSYSTKISTVTHNNVEYYAVTLDFVGGGSIALDNSADKGAWEFSLVIFEKALVKDWGQFQGSVSKSNSYKGTSTNTPQALR